MCGVCVVRGVVCVVGVCRVFVLCVLCSYSVIQMFTATVHVSCTDVSVGFILHKPVCV